MVYYYFVLVCDLICILTKCFVLQSRDCHFKGHSDTVDTLTWHPKHPDRLATASSDKSVRLFDARSNKCTSAIQTKGIV